MALITCYFQFLNYSSSSITFINLLLSNNVFLLKNPFPRFCIYLRISNNCCNQLSRLYYTSTLLRCWLTARQGVRVGLLVRLVRALNQRLRLLPTSDQYDNQHVSQFGSCPLSHSNQNFSNVYSTIYFQLSFKTI